MTQNNTITVASLVLRDVHSAWGAQTVGELQARVQHAMRPVVLRGTRGTTRILTPEQILSAPPDTMLDLLPGRTFAQVVSADLPALSLPDIRPLVVVRGDQVLGLLTDACQPEARPAPAERIVDAQKVVMQRVQSHLGEFRQAGVPIVFDIRDARTVGGTELLNEAVDTLLGEILVRARERGGEPCAHVLLAPGRSGTWLVIEDRVGRLEPELRAAMGDDAVACDHPLVAGYRRLRREVLERGGTMTAKPSPWGVRILACLPSPDADRSEPEPRAQDEAA